MNQDGAAPLDLATLGDVARSGTFEQAMTGLESVVTHLEAGHLSLQDSITIYELGLALSQRCAELLEQADLQIKVLESRYDVEIIEDLDDAEA
jgi:exodeoxyribonuclease VII small subunit